MLRSREAHAKGCNDCRKPDILMSGIKAHQFITTHRARDQLAHIRIGLFVA